ncbi:hypothetical protein [Chitinophaga pinensis]|uniref:Uncharacterized protein n=1 Tax=Chitinophaga pinensis (strain ATCC 43595 / DSM 2588 / LMG 13176 / NBRC 15968 / NCIMB 11800 / UQM 2034) TaxID=485918 RepID=A0A979G5Z6_CHIPD|nr:hypothetical protein [Chitinophaga pinensis]ACU61303.1 hypothetical protein Cpin_3841 [Chitinophaga pinensis DSM 2588]
MSKEELADKTRVARQNLLKELKDINIDPSVDNMDDEDAITCSPNECLIMIEALEELLNKQV